MIGIVKRRAQQHLDAASSNGAEADAASDDAASSSGPPADSEDDAELSNYKEALDNLKQQRDAVSASCLESVRMVQTNGATTDGAA